MKKMMFTLAAVLCCAALFSSCKKAETKQEEKVDNTPAYVELKFAYEATDQMIKYTDMVITYDEGAGEKTENMTSLSYEKTLKANLPCTLKFGRTVKMKDGAEVAEDKFAYRIGCYISYEIYTAAGVKCGKGGTTGGSSGSSLSAAGVVDEIAKGKFNDSSSWTFDKNGNVVK